MSRRSIPLAAAVLLSACAETPSFEVRWRIGASADAEAAAPPEGVALRAPWQCTEVGLFRVLVQTWTEDGAVLLDERDHRCFPASFDDPDAAVAGPSLPPGTYQVRLQGVRRDGVAYAPPEEGRFAPGVTVIGDVVVENPDTTIRLLDEGDDPVLGAPLPCDDGVDNDRDGFVDESDLGCRAGLGTSEDDPVQLLQVRLAPTFFSKNPNMHGAEACLAVGVDRFEVRTTDGELLGEPPCAETVGRAAFLTWVAAEVPEGVDVTAVASDGTPRTVSKRFDLAAGGLTVVEVDFSDADFLEPVVAPFGFVLRFEGGSTDCSDPDEGTLEIPEVRITVLGAHGEPVSPPVTTEGGMVLDGAAPMACPTAAVITEPLPWGGYLVVAEALSDEGDVCFATTSPVPAAPGTPIAFVADLDRIEPPPASCRTCESDGECDPGLVCTADGLCAAP
ncbi:MAG: hypothetical protein D6705_10080 [Deltaproteobacteria bacterium]|nr:MAG: hypothetical protein D6705_10080 [Deltaproteobacteria bacterium]